MLLLRTAYARKVFGFLFLLICWVGLPQPTHSQSVAPVPASDFLKLAYNNVQQQQEVLNNVQSSWELAYMPMLLEIAQLTENRILRQQILKIIGTQTGQQLGPQLNGWLQWLWNQEYTPHPEYAQFKAALYRLIDPRFEQYFDPERNPTIRLDEVLWGGVVQDGIPPLRNPAMIPAAKATYLADDHLVFGVAINGDFRAYPKRIMGWHEMFTDRVGGEPIAGVYCTLCGSMIIYKSRTADGTEHQLGTSGFLYRSNKLMYDKATQSLWNTLWGKPVSGPLVGKGIELEALSVVTTTWGAWKKRHPKTTVLSLSTGYRRDYSEGEAYRDYFATDALMFTTPAQDQRLLNKQEVLSLILPDHPDQPLAISTDYLKRRKLHRDKIGETEFIVLTDRSGASRVYATEGVAFEKWDKSRKLTDESGEQWTLEEPHLRSASGRTLARLPAHRSFWFGWYAAYPQTRLVK